MNTTKQGVRYLIVGIWNTIFGYGLFAVLEVSLGNRIPYILLLAVAQVVATINAFFCYRWLVFKVSGYFWRDLWRFSLVYAGAFAVNLVALPFLVEVFGMNVLVAQALVVGGTIVASFLLHRNFSFGRPGPRQS